MSFFQTSLPLAARGINPGQRPLTSHHPSVPNLRPRSSFSATPLPLNPATTRTSRSSFTESRKRPKSLPKSNRTKSPQNLPSEPPLSESKDQPSPRPEVPTKSYFSGSDAIIIHVHDEARSLSQDVSCNRILLLAHMGYFTDYFADDVPSDDVEVSVHCEIPVFDWLMEYVHCDSSSARPELTPTNCISILISAEFLQMPVLVGECLDYFSSNIFAILRLPVDLSCLSDDLVTRLAERFSVKALDEVVDKGRSYYQSCGLRSYSLCLWITLLMILVLFVVFCVSISAQWIASRTFNVQNVLGRSTLEDDVIYIISLKLLRSCRGGRFTGRFGGSSKCLNVLVVSNSFPSLICFSVSTTLPYQKDQSSPCCNASSARFSELSGCESKQHVVNDPEFSSLYNSVIQPRLDFICISTDENSRSLPRDGSCVSVTSATSSQWSDYSSSSSNSDTDSGTDELKLKRAKFKKKGRKGSRRDLCKGSPKKTKILKHDLIRDSEMNNLNILIQSLVKKRGR
ncbi:hypothetical protein GEMRC1_004449 [Eukaryota sp. GEM-RC1]